MELLIPALIAGVITVASPCTITLLPVILGGSLSEHSFRRPLLIISALAVSMIIFGLLLRATTALIQIDQAVWNLLSGLIIFTLGYFMLFPTVWDSIASKLGFSNKSQELLSKSGRVQGDYGSILMGFSLGPVFSSCSPVYLFVLSAVISGELTFVEVLLNLGFYAVGLAVTLLAIAWLGQRAVAKLKGLSNTEGLFRRHLGLLVLIAGIFIIFGIDKEIQAFLVTNQLNISNLEYIFLP